MRYSKKDEDKSIYELACEIEKEATDLKGDDLHPDDIRTGADEIEYLVDLQKDKIEVLEEVLEDAEHMLRTGDYIKCTDGWEQIEFDEEKNRHICLNCGKHVIRHEKQWYHNEEFLKNLKEGNLL